MMKAFKYMGSPWAASGIAMLLIAIYTSMSFGVSPYAKFAEFIFGSWPGAALWLMLVLSLTAWSVMTVMDRRLPVAVSAEDILKMDEHAHIEADMGIKTLDDVAGWMRDKAAFRGEPHKVEGGIMGIRGRLGVIPGIVLRAGVALLMLGALMSWHMRMTAEVELYDGARADVLGHSVDALSIEASLPDEFLSVGTVGFTLKDINVRLAYEGREFTLSGSRAMKMAGLYWRVRDLGYAQPVSVRGAGDSMLTLRLLPPGSVDTARFSEGGQIYEFRLASAGKVRKGLLTGELYRLKSPLYTISERGKKSAAMTVEADKEYSIGADRVTLGETGVFVSLLAVRDPALPLLKAAFVITALGFVLILLRLFWYERRYVAVMHEGRPLVGYSEEFYSKWAIYKFRQWYQALRVR